MCPRVLLNPLSGCFAAQPAVNEGDECSSVASQGVEHHYGVVLDVDYDQVPVVVHVVDVDGNQKHLLLEYVYLRHKRKLSWN